MLAKILRWRNLEKQFQSKEIWQKYWDLNWFSSIFNSILFRSNVRNSSENSSLNCFITSSLNCFTSKNRHLNQRRKSILELDQARLDLNPISGRPINIFYFRIWFGIFFRDWSVFQRFCGLIQVKAEMYGKIFTNCSFDMFVEAALIWSQKTALNWSQEAALNCIIISVLY